MRRFRLFIGSMSLATAFIAIACSHDDSGSGAEATAAAAGGASSTATGSTSTGSTNSGSASGGASTTTSTSTGSSTSGSGGGDVDAGPIVAPQPLSPYIVVDQFGYRTAAEKIAVLRSPQDGFDKGATYAPGAMYAVVDAHTSKKLLEGAPVVWNGGAVDASSGDHAWWFDFSTVTTPGDYFLLDETANVRSAVFHISDSVYRDALKASIRMLYYQRDGIAKDAAYAGADWVDAKAHPQDMQCGLYSDGSAKKDLHGGWFDAGDQNKYTNWAASDVIELLRAYVEKPSAFSDDYGIPESGNGVPDLLDEVKWEIDWIVRMQNADGSVLSIVGHDGASPPSADAKPCKYGPANTSAALTSAAAFASASMVFASVSAANMAYPGFAADLASRAGKAWTWANANPNVTFFNSQNNVGAGEQETDGNGRLDKKVQAAAFLFELTGTAAYRTFFDANYTKLEGAFDPFHMEQIDTLLEYTKAAKATANVAQGILGTFKTGVTGAGYFGAMQSKKDPYLAYLQDYTWGSNQVKAGQGNMYSDVVSFAVDAGSSAEAIKYAERYVHYFHGVNPLSLVYLSNMAGTEKSVTRFFHTWFANGSKWDAIGVSMYGPPPGYLVGGPNPGYTWDGCCPGNCGSAQNNALCGNASPAPPTGQPAQKAYKDFNDAWPLDSWQISEPDVGYQAQYIRLLAKFVD